MTNYSSLHNLLHVFFFLTSVSYTLASKSRHCHSLWHTIKSDYSWLSHTDTT